MKSYTVARNYRLGKALLCVLLASPVPSFAEEASEENVYLEHRVAMKAELTGAPDRRYPGDARLSALFLHGEMTFPDSPYGPLHGRFATMPPEQGRAVTNSVWNWRSPIETPMVNPHTQEWPLYGLVYLYAGRELVVRCHVGAKAVVPTGMQMMMGQSNAFRAEGVCADRKGRSLTIAFGTVKEGGE